MMTVLLVLHLIVTLALIGVVLLQRSEGGGLGIGSSGGMGSFMTGRGTANLLTRTTGVLATLFMVLALAMALLGRGQSAPAPSWTCRPALPSPRCRPARRRARTPAPRSSRRRPRPSRRLRRSLRCRRTDIAAGGEVSGRGRRCLRRPFV
ncbi:preprotein translocase subunit SecG [Pseudoroseomonas wenyumeiae]